MAKYRYVKKQVSKHTRYDPRLKKRVNVGQYPRNQRIRDYRTISYKLAHEIDEKKNIQKNKPKPKRYNYAFIKIKIAPYTYTRKDGKEISVPEYKRTLFLEPNEIELTTRKIRGEQRWVEIFQYKGKTYMRVFTDLRKNHEISQNEEVKKWVYNKETMTKTLPDNLAKGFKEIAKDKTEHSIMVDFERGLTQPQRVAIVQGGGGETLKYSDFELFGHTHPGSWDPIPSTGDLRNMRLLEPEFIVAGKTGKMIIVNIEDPVQYERWKARMSRKGGATNPIPYDKYGDLLEKKKREGKYLNLCMYDHSKMSKTKQGRELFFEETGVKIYPYRKTTALEMRDDPHLEKRMPSVDPIYLKKWKSKK